MKTTYTIDEKTLAFVVDDGCEDYVTPEGPGYWLECLSLLELEISIPGNNLDKTRRYVVRYEVNKGDSAGAVPNEWEASYESFTDAYNKFKSEIEGSKYWSKPFLRDRFELDYGCLYDDGTPYSRSASNGDYGPSDPWNAPGMTISDFLPGVY